MFPSLINCWKTLLISLAAITVNITPIGTTVTPQTMQTQSTANITGGTSRNWSGYETTNGSFTTVTGTWTIPQATGSGHTSMDAAWVGIGGIRSSDLIQSGTQNVINPSGQITTTAFYELLPASSQTLPIIVKAGDSITVSITQQTTNQWHINFNNNTTGQNYQNTLSYNSSLSSTEWIEEAPSTGRTIVPLDNFGTIKFSAGSTTQNGSIVTIASSSAQAITMVNNNQEVLASPSDLNSDGAGFSITRTSNLATASISDLDKNPQSWRRRGMDIGSFTTRTRWHYMFPTRTLIQSSMPRQTSESTQTPEPSISDVPSVFIQRKFQFRGFGFRRNFNHIDANNKKIK